MLDIRIENVASMSHEGRGVWFMVHRPHPLGNPFRMRNEGDREKVIAEYRQWLWKQIRCGNKEVLWELSRIVAAAKRGDCVHLVCFCAPKRCHAEIIRDCVTWMISTNFFQRD